MKYLIPLFFLSGLSMLSLNLQAQVWSNEIHYDNNGSDMNERVEVAGIAGTNLAGWSIVYYDGSNGTPYATSNLTGTIPNLCSGTGVVVIDVPGTNGGFAFQNGGGFPDGWALVNASGTAVELFSYEGVFVASSGPAMGMTSVDIGVEESGAGSVNGSIQRTGASTWVVDGNTNTFGMCNSIQYVQASIAVSTTAVVTPTCNGDSNGLITVQASGGIGNYTYLWSNGGTNATIQNLPAGTYTVTVTDAGGNTATTSAILSEPLPLTATPAAYNDVACPNDMTGSVVFTLTGGNGPSTYTYPPSGSPLLPAGLYSITITGNLGCTTIGNFDIISLDSEAPVITCPASVSFCDQGLSFSFSEPTVTDNCSDPVTLMQFSGPLSGTYFPEGVNTIGFVATDQTGNSASCTFTVTVFPAPDIALVSAMDDVNGTGVGAINISPLGGTPPFVYDWTFNGAFFSNTEDISGLMAGSYVVLAADANGCTVSAAPFVINNVVGTNRPFQESGIEINPNPATDFIVLNSQTVLPQSLKVFDNNGKLVIARDQFKMPLQLDLSGLSSGIYQILLTDEAGAGYFSRVVKR